MGILTEGSTEVGPVEITQHWLGMEPYVLIQLKLGDEGPEDVRARIERGGGVDTMSEVGSVLAMALSGLDDDDNPLAHELTDLVTEHPEHAAVVAMIRERLGWSSVDQGKV